MKYRIVLIVGLILLPLICPAQEIKLPVFFLRYDGGLGSEEIVSEEEEIEPSSQRHKITLRIKEEWSDSFTTNLYTAVFRKEYFLQAGSYYYFYLNPDMAWEITDRIKWYTGFRSKFTFYDELDLDGLSKDFTSLLAKTNFTFKPADKRAEQDLEELKIRAVEEPRENLSIGAGVLLVLLFFALYLIAMLMRGWLAP